MSEYQCEICGRPYRSKSGLKGHLKSHRKQAESGQVATPIAATKPAKRGGPIINNKPQPAALKAQSDVATHAWLTTASQEEAGLLSECLTELGIDPKDVMAFKVYPPDAVAVIVGPVGFKYSWMKGAKR